MMVLVQQLLGDEAFRTPSPLSHKHRHPQVMDIPHSLHEPMDVELPFLNLPGEFDTGNDNGGVVETFKTQHRPRAALNATVVLFDDVVQVGAGAKNRLGREDRFVLEVLDCPVRGWVTIERDFLWCTVW